MNMLKAFGETQSNEILFWILNNGNLILQKIYILQNVISAEVLGGAL